MPRLRVPRTTNRVLQRATAATAIVGAALAGGVVVGDVTGADAAGRILVVSSHPDRSGARELAGQTVSGRVYVFVKAPAHTSKIVFYLDGSRTPVSTERAAPFDLATTAPGGAARPFDASGLRAGPHAIRYTMTVDGRTVTDNAGFTVAPRAGDVTSPVAASGALGLDRTGRTVPDSAYPAPAAAIFLSTTGADDNPGTKDEPVSSLTRALSLVPAGGTVVVRGGVYRDWYSSGGAPRVVGKPFTLQAYPHEQVWFDGTDPVPGSRFRPTGSGSWTLAWSTPSFCEGTYYTRAFDAPSRSPRGAQCAYWDSALGYRAGRSPDGVRRRHAAAGGLLPRSGGRRELRLRAGPRGPDRHPRPRRRPDPGRTSRSRPGRPRSSSRGRVPASSASASAGTRLHHPRHDHGRPLQRPGRPADRELRLRAERRPRLQRDASGGGRPALGLRGQRRQRDRVERALRSRHHRRGLRSAASLFEGNNAEGFDTQCSASCTVANIKLAHMVGVTVRDNIIADARGRAKGVWCDLACRYAVIVRNVVSGNGGHGIFYEVSDRGIIASIL